MNSRSISSWTPPRHIGPGALAVCLAALFLAVMAGRAHAGLRGHYYNMSGDPAAFGALLLERTDATVNFDWGLGSFASGQPADNFAVSWRGIINIPTEGDWTFYTSTDDGTRVYVDGQRIIDAWVNQGVTEYAGTKYLTAGKHQIVFDYFERGGGAFASLSYAGPGVGKQIIPDSATTPLPSAPTGLRGRYHSILNQDGAWGPMAGTRVDGNIAFAPGFDPGFGLGTETFGIRWTGKINIPTTGNWRFHAFADDAARFYIDTSGSGNLQRIIDHWTLGGAEYSSGFVFLHGGLHDIAVDFYENSGAQYIELRWEGPNQGKDIVPQSAFLEHQNGLITELYNNETTSGEPVVLRNDYYIRFDWAGAPQDGINADGFSVRWRGKVLAPATGAYTFYTSTDDGAELWVNGQRIIDLFSANQPETEWPSTAVNLVAGQKYFIEFRMREGGGGAAAKLRWSGPGVPKQIIPDQNLFPILNEAPTGVSLSQDFFYDDQAPNSAVGALSTADPDNVTGGSQTHTYALVSGTGSTHNNLFSIAGSELRVNNPATMARGTYSIRVRTTDNGRLPDNLTADSILSITCRDRTSPVINNCPANFSLPANASCQNVIPNFFNAPYSVTGSDGPNPAPAMSQSPPAGATFGPSPVTVTITANDGSPYSANTTCQVTISIVDNTPPVALCRPYTLDLDVKQTVAFADINNGSSDNCGLNLAATIISPNSFDCGDLGPNTVTLTVFDTSGNSHSCQTTVTVTGSLSNTLLSAATLRFYEGDSLSAPMLTEAACGAPAYGFAWFYDPDGFGSGAPALTLNDGAHPASGGTTVSIGGATPQTSLNMTGLGAGAAGYYRSRVTDSATDSADSAVVSLDVQPALFITQSPVGGHKNTGQSHQFSVAVEGGYAPYEYAWFFNGGGGPVPLVDGTLPSGAVVSGADMPDLTITNLQLSSAGDYFCVITDNVGTGSGSVEQTGPTNLTVTDLLSANGPAPLEAYIYGTSQSFAVTASGGDSAYTFAWEWDADGFGTGTAPAQPLSPGSHPNGTTSVAITNAGSVSTLALANITQNASGSYRCTVRDGSPDPDVVSAVATLQKRSAVAVSVTPSPVTRRNYVDALTLSANPTGGFTAYTYQWAFSTDGGTNWTNLVDDTYSYSRPGFDPRNPGVFNVGVDVTITGAQGPVLVIDHPLHSIHNGLYRCTVKDSQYPIQGLPQGTASAQSSVTVPDQLAVVRQPVGGEYYEGNNEEVDVAVIGGTVSAPDSYIYNWRLNGTPIDNSNLNPYMFVADADPPQPPGGPYLSTTGSPGNYRVFVSGGGLSGAAGAVFSNTAPVAVQPAVSVTLPATDTKNASETFTVTAAVSGGYPASGGVYAYAWTWNSQVLANGPHPSGSGAVISGATTGTLTVTGLGKDDDGTYEVVVNDSKAPCPDHGNKCRDSASIALTVTNNILVSSGPAGADIYTGDPVDFDVSVTGGNPGTYEFDWKWDFGAGEVTLPNSGAHPSGSGALLSEQLVSADTHRLTVTGAGTGDNGDYYCIVRDANPLNAEATSAAAALTVWPPVEVTVQPQPLNRYVGQAAVFTVQATGGIGDARTFQWEVNTGSGWSTQLNSGNVSGADTASLTIFPLVAGNNGAQYRCRVTAPASDVTSPNSNREQVSGVAALTVSSPLAVLSSPANVTAYITDPAFTLEAQFEGGMPFTTAPEYQTNWRRTGVNPVAPEASAGAGVLTLGTPNAATLQLIPGALGAGVYDFRVNLTDRVQTTASGAARVTVVNLLNFDQPLQGAAVRDGEQFEWSVVVSGGMLPLTYQWQKQVDDGTKALVWVDVPDNAMYNGVDTDTLEFTNVTFDDAGTYRVVVSDSGTEQITSSAQLVVEEALPVGGAIGLALTALLTALGGAAALRRRK